MDVVATIKDLFVQSGAAWVMWLLFALSAGSIFVAVERALFFRSKDGDLKSLIVTLESHLWAGEFDEALEAVKRRRTLGAAVARAGLKLADRGAAAAEKAMQSALTLERKALEARLGFLGTLGNNAPFIGLFGTVIGVVLAFDALGAANQATGSSAGQAASQEVMAAIAEALVATAVGIAVALPAVALYNYFQRRITVMMSDAEALSDLVVAYLVDETRAPEQDRHRGAD